jgi:hypothetical protein
MDLKKLSPILLLIIISACISDEVFDYMTLTVKYISPVQGDRLLAATTWTGSDAEAKLVLLYPNLTKANETTFAFQDDDNVHLMDIAVNETGHNNQPEIFAC